MTCPCGRRGPRPPKLKGLISSISPTFPLHEWLELLLTVPPTDLFLHRLLATTTQPIGAASDPNPTLALSNSHNIFYYPMSTPTRTQHYITIANEQYPINLSATGIKCITCAQYYPQSQIQQHLSTHINPQYASRVAVSTQSPQRVKLDVGMEEEPGGLDQLWVRSYGVGDLAQVEVRKREAARLGAGESVLVAHRGAKVPRVCEDTQAGVSDSLGDVEEKPITVDERLRLKQKVRFSQVPEKIDKKVIHMYMSENKTVRQYDTNTITPKQLKPQAQTQASQGYSVLKSTLGAGPAFNLPSPSQPGSNIQRYNLGSNIKNLGQSRRINTATKLLPSSSRLTVLDDPTNMKSQRSETHHIHREFQCRDCHGFYCKQCKSTIPPIYRPVPDKDGRYHFNPGQNERATEFYSSVYYPMTEGRTCTHCEAEGRRQPEREKGVEMTPVKKLDNTRLTDDASRMRGLLLS